MKHIHIYLLSVICFLISCSGNQYTKTTEETRKERSFQFPEIPVMLDTPDSRKAYLCEHYWDNFNFSDTAYIHLPDITEQAIVNFMDLTTQVSKELSERSISNLYQKAAPHSSMLWYFWETMSRYWKDPNSPLRHEEMFIRLCRCVGAISQMEEGIKIRASFALSLAEKNQVGHPAIDFTYTTASGKQGQLHALKAEYILLFFHNPDCETCRETKDAMKQSAILQAGISSGKLKVLTLYPDEDVELWQAHLEELSDEWINGYDKGQVLTRNALYDLSAIPSFYLLDKNKKVLLKDADWNQVTQLLSVQ